MFLVMIFPFSIMSLPIHIAFDALSAVDGSARFSFAHTTAIASVSGPITPRPATEHPVRAAIDVHVRPLPGVSATPEKHVASALRGVLERACVLAQLPRTAIQVVVQVLSPLAIGKDGDVDKDVRLAAQINAASLALLNAGSVPMRGVVCAVSVAQAQSGQPQLVTDPSRDKTPAAYSGCFAFLFGVDPAYASPDDQDMDTDTANDAAPPAKMIWTNCRACPGEAFSTASLAQAEQEARKGAAIVWMKMKASVSAP